MKGVTMGNPHHLKNTVGNGGEAGDLNPTPPHPFGGVGGGGDPSGASRWGGESLAKAKPLRPHQIKAMAMLRTALGSGGLSPMLQAPTGAGKTRLAAEIVDGALAKGKRVLIVVPAVALIDQTLAAFEDEGIRDVGVIQGIHQRTDCTAPVQLASVQSLQRRAMPDVDVILIDEAHRWFLFFAGMIADAKAAGIPVIGLSATPWTKGLGRHFDDLLVVTTTKDLVDEGYLSRFRVFAPSHPDLSTVGTVAGDYHEGQLAEAMNTDNLVADVVTTWMQRGEKRPTLCFAVDRAHAKHLQQQFITAGVAAGYIDSYTTREERAKVRHQFHTGELQVVANVGCLTTGVDWDVRCIILARPTKSEMLFVQMVGRGLRTAAGKDDCLIFDHSDTHLRLGFVTDIHHDHLDGGPKLKVERRERIAVPTECPSCHYLRPPKVWKCPSCGFQPERQNAVEVEDGELVELGNKPATKISTDRKVSVLGQLRRIARQRRYASGWASHKYREFFGTWPNGLPWVAEVEPTPEILGWVRSKQIAFSKMKEKHDARTAS